MITPEQWYATFGAYNPIYLPIIIALWFLFLKHQVGLNLGPPSHRVDNPPVYHAS